MVSSSTTSPATTESLSSARAKLNGSPNISAINFVGQILSILTMPITTQI